MGDKTTEPAVREWFTLRDRHRTGIISGPFTDKQEAIDAFNTMREQCPEMGLTLCRTEDITPAQSAPAVREWWEVRDAEGYMLFKRYQDRAEAEALRRKMLAGDPRWYMYDLYHCTDTTETRIDITPSEAQRDAEA